jgi:CRP-like cAMP-binding protein
VFYSGERTDSGKEDRLMYRPPKQTMGESGANGVNRILAALPSEEYDRLSPYLQPVSLPLGQILHMPEETIDYVYFPTSSLISLLAMLEGGETVEAGMIGSEGMAGISVVLGVESTTTQALVQGAGEALRMKAKTLRSFIKDGGPLHDLLLRYTHTIFAQIAQTAACNRVHSLNERLARWLLLTHDRTQRNNLDLTHEFAARMLGTRRAGVSVAASALREAGLIDYLRGQVVIRNRAGLEDASCECYGIVKAEFDRLFKS